LEEEMNLSEALHRIAEYLNLSADELIAYAGEDTVGGYHEDASLAKWPMGSVWEVEGQILYAIVRALKPKRSLAIGHLEGCSSAHICEALHANGSGKLDIIDKNDEVTLDSQYAGIAKLKQADLFTYRWPRGGYQFVFEDAMHTEETTEKSWRVFHDKAQPGSVIVSHDSEHYRIGDGVKRGIERVTTDYISLLIEPGKCGLAIGRKR
jgi:predicted O-methyltransferase YrrM